ncbi:MAG: hypothetical protein FWE61_04220, partial [Micrococcales bacterium]|nr:hypothetical protein [Micrococcales bacterium]
PGGELPVLPGGADGARLAALAQGLCWPDPRHRLGLPQAVDQLAGRGPVWRAPVSAPVPGPAPAYVPGTTPVAVRPAPAAPPAPRRWSRVFVALGALAVVVLAVVGVVWQGSRDGPSGAGTGPASDPATRPAPNPTYTFEPDAAAYPPFEGLNAAVTAFPLLSDDLPQCRRVAPAQYVPAGAREVFACVWDDLDATVYLSRWATGFAGAEAWRDTVGPDALERSWGTASTGPDHERGPRFAWGENPSHRVICYRDLPYCMEIVSAVQDITDEVYDRIGGLDTDDAAGFVARWPDVDPDFALPEPS